MFPSTVDVHKYFLNAVFDQFTIHSKTHAKGKKRINILPVKIYESTVISFKEFSPFERIVFVFSRYHLIIGNFNNNTKNLKKNTHFSAEKFRQNSKFLRKETAKIDKRVKR